MPMPAAIIGAVAGDVDDAPAGAKRAAGKQRRSVIDGPADRGAAAEQLARHAFDRGGKGRRGLLVTDRAPFRHLDLHHRSRPLHHGDGDRLVRSRADRLQHAGMAKGCDIAALLQVKTHLIDAARGVDREHELQVDRGLRSHRQ